ncbi:MAG: LytTR family DNA-binding domain-containing protein [Pseudomonadota bacterium]
MSGPFDIGDVSPRRYFAVVAVVLGLLFAFVAGDDDSGPALFGSLVIWQLQSFVPMLLLLASHMAWSWLPLFDRQGPWLQLLISGLSGALMFSPLAALLDHYLEGAETVFGTAAIVNEAVSIAPPITLAWIAINAPFVLGLRLTNTGRDVVASHESRLSDRTCAEGPGLGDGDGREAGAAQRPVGTEENAEHDRSEAGASRPDHRQLPFMRLVAPTMRGRVIYLQAELHYLAVVTEHGRSLILYNLRDAANELAGESGLLTHRSFWVAVRSIRGFRRRGRQGMLHMENGDEIPVSRRRINAISDVLGKADGVA